MSRTTEQNSSFPSGSAGCTTSSLSSGSHSITAVYSGDGNYNGSTSSGLSQMVAVVIRLTGESVTGYYSSIQDAYDGAVDGDIIDILGITLSESLFIDRENISVLLQGGCDENFQPVTDSFSTLGPMEISSGGVEIDGIILK